MIHESLAGRWSALLGPAAGKRGEVSRWIGTGGLVRVLKRIDYGAIVCDEHYRNLISIMNCSIVRTADSRVVFPRVRILPRGGAEGGKEKSFRFLPE